MAAGAGAETYRVEPGSDYRRLLQKLTPGDELVFLHGVHEQHASFELSGTAASPIIIRGQRQRAAGQQDDQSCEIRWTERGHNTWKISGKHLIIQDLTFHNRHHYGVRVGRGSHITFERCAFTDNGGGDFSANSGNIESLTVRDCRFFGGERTCVYIGSHSGRQRVRDFRFEGNLVDASEIEHPNIIGYGIQLKLNVDGIIRGNLILGSKGPGIMIYGSEETGRKQLVEHNIVVGSRHSANIVVGGGPAVVRRNVALASRRHGIAVLNYGNRNLLRELIVAENAMSLNERGSLSLPSEAEVVQSANRSIMPIRESSDRPASKGAENPAAADLETIVRRLQADFPSNQAIRTAADSLRRQPVENRQQLLQLLGNLSEG